MTDLASRDTASDGPATSLRPWPLMRRNDNGHPVRTLQSLLRARGRNVAVDGDFGQLTDAAVRAFQSSRGLAVDGLVGEQTWSALIITVSRSSTGDAVRGVQEEFAFRCPSGTTTGLAVDGIFGTKTDTAVRSYQEALKAAVPGIAVDGIVGPVTWRALISSMLPAVVVLDGLEVVQEIQDLQHTVPLVAGKATVVRAYLGLAGTPVAVRGTIEVGRSADGPWSEVGSLGTAQLDPSRVGSSGPALRGRRADLNLGLAFTLGAGLTAEGPVWVRVSEVTTDAGTPLASLTAGVVRQVRFRAAPTLRVRLVQLRYRWGNPQVVMAPVAADVSHFRSWLRRAYPVRDVDMTTTVVDAQPVPEFGAAQINAQLTALRALDVATGTDARTHYYGMVSDGGFFMRGLASAVPGSAAAPDTVASGPTGSPAGQGYSWDTDGSYGDWYGGHELAHTFGRFHAEFCGAQSGAPYPFTAGQLSDADEAFVGLDVGDPALGLPLRVLSGVTSHDVMTYCENQWLSSFTYQGVYDRLMAEEALPAGGAGGSPESAGDPRTAVVATTATAGGAGPASSAPDEIRLVGSLNLTQGTGSISAVLPAPSGATAPQSGAAPSPVGSVQLLDADGSIVDEQPVAFLPSICDRPGDDRTGMVDMILPIVGAASVRLLIGDQIVDTHPVGGASSAIGPALPNASGPAPGSETGPIEVRWDATAAPIDQRYAVQVRGGPDGEWRTVAVGLPEPVVRLDPNDFDGTAVEVRVLSTTGTSTTVSSAETVQLR